MSEGASDFERISAALANRLGEERAITIEDLVMVLARPETATRRQVELVLAARLCDFPFPLVSSSKGYFIPETADEINHYRNSLLSRIRCLAVRSRVVRAKCIEAGFIFEGGRFVALAVQRDLSHVG